MTDSYLHALVIVGLVILGLLWLLQVVKHRRAEELKMYQRIRNNEMTYDDIRRMTGYNRHVARQLYKGYEPRQKIAA